MTAAPAPDVTDRTDASDEEFAARIAAFDGEAYPVEVLAVKLHAAACNCGDNEVGDNSYWLTIARAAIAALAPQPAEHEGIWLR